MILLGIDPAISCGWCVSEIENDTLTLIDCGFIEVSKCEYSGDTCLDLQKQIRELFEKFNVDEMVIEDYIFKSKTCQGSHINVYLRCACHMLCRELEKPYYIIPISNWKSIIAGRSTPSKEMKTYWGKELANKVFIQEALWVRYNIRFPNHSLSKKTKKPIKIKYDMIDAVGISIAYGYSKYMTTTICNIIEFPNDVDMKTVRVYNYE